jgi:hypothetical protein
VVYWDGGTDALEEAALAEADAVVVYGEDATVRRVRDRLPVTTRLVAYHHRTSVALVGGDLDGPGGLAAAAADDADFGAAPATLRDAMVAFPEMVSGTGRPDAALMAAGRGDWVAKVGAEGVQAIGIASLGIGIAVKVADGAKRALLPVVVAVLDQLGLLDAARREVLTPYARPNVLNYRGIITGTIEPVVELRGR